MLNAAQIQQFQRDGFLVIPKAACAETVQIMLQTAKEQLTAGIAPVEYEADVGYPGAPDSRDADGGQTIRRLLNAYARDNVFRDWVKNSKNINSLKQLLGGEELWLTQAHHNCVMTKQPGFSSKTMWHQDIRYWAFDNSNLVNMWLALTDETIENGCLKFIPGSQNISVPAEQYDAALFLRTEDANNQPLLEQAVDVPLNAGDMVYFHAKTFHAAGNNQTIDTKFSAVFTFHNECVHPIPATRSAHAPEVLISAN